MRERVVKMDRNPDNREFLGRGLGFPLRVNARGEIALVSGERDIEESIRVILGTRPGERVMRPEFGCRAHELLFEPRNASTETLMQQYVSDALRMWEPRITVQWVDVLIDENQDGAILVEVYYMIEETHNERSIVYPFFLVGEEEW
jgi:phage baseplate assembly protein W